MENFFCIFYLCRTNNFLIIDIPLWTGRCCSCGKKSIQICSLAIITVLQHPSRRLRSNRHVRQYYDDYVLLCHTVWRRMCFCEGKSENIEHKDDDEWRKRNKNWNERNRKARRDEERETFKWASAESNVGILHKEERVLLMTRFEWQWRVGWKGKHIFQIDRWLLTTSPHHNMIRSTLGSFRIINQILKRKKKKFYL